MKRRTPWQEAVELAFASAQKRLRAMDPRQVAEQSASRLGTADHGEYLEITFLNQRYQVLLPEAEVKSRTVALPASGSRRPYGYIVERERHPDIQIFIQSSAGRFAENTENTAPLHSIEQAGGAPLGRMRGPCRSAASPHQESKGWGASGRCRKAAGETGGEPSLVRRVLILHYLIQAQGSGLAGRWVDFRSLPGGVVYYPVFRKRVIARLIRMFGERPQEVIPAAAPLGGRAIAMADWAIEIPAFARVPVVFALWEGSQEFGPQGQVMYDASIPAYLETEDAIIVCEEIMGAMKHNVQSV